ncbi:MAG: hypothetical protein L6R40_002510 [Gallowayella cf. fulva]|nr:MAG: hypothetical protein L6R40_002510 [Xanthomendoza cf. fulva]
MTSVNERRPEVNVFLLASDNSAQLLPWLRSHPSAASSQDESGYSLLHAAASWNHPDLLRTLFHEFHVDPDIRDKDGETALFVTETVQIARILVEEMHCDISIANHDELIAEERIRSEGEFVTVADYLKTVRVRRANGSSVTTHESNNVELEQVEEEPLPPLPPNVTVNMGTTTEDEVPEEADPAFRARIEELASRDDFQGVEGQRQLRELVTEAIRGVERESETRDVRRRRVE